MDVEERFLKYISFDTSSEEDVEEVPSTEKQKVLGRYLTRELEEMGLKEVRLDEHGYVYGLLPASQGAESEKTMGLIAHMDTSPAVSGDEIHPHSVDYRGGDIYLESGVVMKAKEFEILEKYIGERLIVTDGTTLLGADDKAGISEIFTALEYLVAHPEKTHPAIRVCITPDEEVGRGTDFFDFDWFRAEYAYTVDGGTLGEIEYENFNAASAIFTIHGVNIHPGYAKNKMKNAIWIASKLVMSFPESEMPAHTCGYEGFYHVCDMSGNESEARIHMIIRDHDREKFEERKAFAKDMADFFNRVYSEGTVEVRITDSYYNMKEKIEPEMWIVEKARAAFARCGIEAVDVPIRGGTDGARLSFEGIPCPNLSTGGENFHGIYEFVSVNSMRKMTEVLVSLCTLK